MEKNTVVPIYLELWDTTTNSKSTTADDSANMTMQCSKDGAQHTAGAGAFALVTSSTGANIGIYKYTPTLAETNGNSLYFRPSTTTANLVLVIAGMYTQTTATQLLVTQALSLI
jgi:hypothetical protein